MSVRRIALGVFLGNLAFGLVALIVASLWSSSAETDAIVDRANADYNAMRQ